MAQHRITVQRASEDELATLASWYRLTDPQMPYEPDDELNGRYVGAFRSGVLGSALGLGLEGIGDAMLRHSDLPDQFMARTLVSSVRLDGKTIGMLVMGPPSALYVRIMHRVTAPPERVERLHLGLTILLSKLDLVCIAAAHRGRGLGSRLVRQAIDIARKSMVRQMYGQFRTEQGLTPFYENLGFEVGNPGDTLSVFAGSEVEIFGEPTETPFSKSLDCPSSALSR